MNRTDTNAISEARKQKTQRKRLFAIIGVALTVIAIIVFALNFRNIGAPWENIGELLPGRREPGEGAFPVRLPGSVTTIESFGDGFMLLSPTYVYTYDASGAQRSARRHGYSAPARAVGAGSVLVYDQNGRKFSLYNMNGRLYEVESDDLIVYGAVGAGGYTAIVFRSETHTNYLSVYDSAGNWKYTKRFTGENIMQVAFMNNRDIIVTTVGFEAGNLCAVVRRLDITSDDESGLWRVTLSGAENPMPIALSVSGNTVFAICAGALFTLDAAEGELIGNYSWSGVMIDCALSNSTPHIALLINDYTTGRVNLLVFDETAVPHGIVSVVAGASQVEFPLRGEHIIVLAPGRLAFYEEFTLTETIMLDEDFARFICLDKEILMLGYNTVEKLGAEEE